MSGAGLAPVFIVGAHRSGTTWLQQLFTETGCFDYVTAYHVIEYERLPPPPHVPEKAPGFAALAETFRRLGLETRGVDDVPPTPGLPEEYGFILHNAGVGYTLTRRSLPLFFEVCDRVRRCAEPRPIVLKNPWDASNFLFIKRAIPAAKFVFIQRDPRRVISSSLVAARAVLGEYNAYTAMLSRDYAKLFAGGPLQHARLALHRLTISSTGRLGVRYVTSRVAAVNDYYVKNISRLPAGDHVSVRYEDLCDRPAEELGRALGVIGVDPSRAASLQTPPRPRRGRLLPEVEWYDRAIAQKNAAYMAMQGYARG
jgi:hypothetical protein